MWDGDLGDILLNCIAYCIELSMVVYYCVLCGSPTTAIMYYVGKTLNMVIKFRLTILSREIIIFLDLDPNLDLDLDLAGPCNCKILQGRIITIIPQQLASFSYNAFHSLPCSSGSLRRCCVLWTHGPPGSHTGSMV